MSDEVFDCIVVGLGAHGSSCIAQLAKESCKVLGLEKFNRGHTQGSSHGRSRVIRQAYFEDPRYVPLVKRSFELWRELAIFESTQKEGKGDNISSENQSSLLNVCGGLMIGSSDSEIITGTLTAAEVHKLPHEILTAQDIRERYPALCPSDDLVGVFETEAGYLIPEACIEAHLQMAEQSGATLRFNESLVSWHEVEGGQEERPPLLQVKTNMNSSFLTRKLVLSVGAWAPEIYGSEIPISLHAERRVLFWFKPVEDTSSDSMDCFRNMPVFLWDNSTPDNVCQFYGFPVESSGKFSHTVKIARHQAFEEVVHDNGELLSARCMPDSIERQVSSAEMMCMQDILKGKVPSLSSGSVVESATCLYTLTSDEHFLIDFHPRNKNIILASPCSGHGFKFSSVVGEILKELVIHGSSTQDISLFSINSRLQG